MKINAPSLYNAFCDKRTLFDQTLKRYLQKKAIYLPEALNEPTTARRVAERLSQGAIDLAMNPKHPDGCLLVQGALATGPPNVSIRKALSTRRAGALALLQHRLKMAIDSGELPTDTDSAILAQYLLTVVWGMSVQATGGASRRQLVAIAVTAMRC